MPVQIVPLILFSDDTSGNRSKKWNKFDIWAIMLAGLPKSENAKVENIHLISASNKLSAISMSGPIVEDLIMLEKKGMVAFDASMNCDVLVIARVICSINDNVRASELVNHLGSSSNLFCRVCQVNFNLWYYNDHLIIMLKQ